MGSFDVTCNISHLPITNGDKVRVLFLGKNSGAMDPANPLALTGGDNSRERCYSTDFWYPRNVPIRAAYYDYGQVKDVEEGIVRDFTMAQLDRELVEMPLGENEYHDPAVSKGMDWDTMWDCAQEGRLRGHKNYHGVATPICVVMIREDVWQAMLALDPGQSYEFLDEEVDGKKYRYVSRTVEYIKEKISTAFVESLNAEPPFIYREHTRELWLAGNSHSGDSGLEYFFRQIVDRSRKNGWTLETPEVQVVIQGMAEMKCVSDHYTTLRKTWHPGTGQGSQDVEFEATARYHHAMALIGYRAAKQANIRHDSWEDYENRIPKPIVELDPVSYMTALEPSLPSNID